MAEDRLQKILSQAGVASRRQAEKIMLEGRVTVNGAVTTELGSKADLERDHVKVDGRLLHPPKRLSYIVLNKPNNTVTTVSDPQHRATVMELLHGVKERVYPVGRLDYHSEGLLLLTNDGEAANARLGVERLLDFERAIDAGPAVLGDDRDGHPLTRLDHALVTDEHGQRHPVCGRGADGGAGEGRSRQGYRHGDPCGQAEALGTHLRVRRPPR